jgi:hypothetical protein
VMDETTTIELLERKIERLHVEIEGWMDRD